MKKPPYYYVLGLLLLMSNFSFGQNARVAGRMNELFLQTVLIPENNTPTSNNLMDPWEITYGPDDSLWVTEAKGYKVKKIHPDNGGQRTIINLASTTNGGTFNPSSYRRTFNTGISYWPQGGMMGLAIHPDYNAGTPKRYVYLAYVKTYEGQNITYNGEYVAGRLFMTSIVRFTYANGVLGSPVILCDTIRGSNDHNSGRMIIAPVGGVNYLFYACGDMGGGQFDNYARVNKAQILSSYEGKILRFNLEEDADADQGTVDYNRWIPNDNPYNGTLGVQSAVWSTGIRNNQGFALNPLTNVLYGASHGPHSDDELNIISGNKNYGHPLVIGFAADNNYNSSSAGKPGSSLPIISNEATNASGLANYQDPVFTAYARDQPTINNIYLNSPPNGGWPSEGWSGIAFDTSSVIPGQKNSILLASLKWGRIVRLKLNAAGTGIDSIGKADTTSFFGSRNRFRDLAMSPDGRSWYVVMDRSTTSSGPSNANPTVPDCLGCLQKYTFLGYKRSMVAGQNEKSTIDTSTVVSMGTANATNNGRTVTINSTLSNDTVWVPITGPDGDLMMEVKAKMGATNSFNLGTVTSSFYRHTGTVREDASSRLYLNRSFNIKFQNTPTRPIGIRLYFTEAEIAALIPAIHSGGGGSGVTGPGSLSVRVNSDANATALTATTSTITPTIREKFAQGATYVVQFTISSNYSNNYSFYLGSPNVTLPLQLLTFKGILQDNNTSLLEWETINESNTGRFEVERSNDGSNYTAIGTVAAAGNSSTKLGYSYIDNDVISQPGTIVYYRLKMIDKDGQFKYSNIITININRIAGQVIVLPNPITDEGRVKALITSAISGKAKWSLIDSHGRTLIQNSVELQKGNNVLYIAIENLASGIYYLNISGKGIDQKVKVQKL